MLGNALMAGFCTLAAVLILIRRSNEPWPGLFFWAMCAVGFGWFVRDSLLPPHPGDTSFGLVMLTCGMMGALLDAHSRGRRSM